MKIYANMLKISIRNSTVLVGIILFVILLSLASGNLKAQEDLDHIFINMQANSIRNDLHIVYKYPVDSAKASGKGLQSRAAYNPPSKTVDIKFGRNININDSLKVSAFSKKKNKVKSYYWTNNDTVVSSVIKVAYKTISKVDIDENGNFRKELAISKPYEIVVVKVARGEVKVNKRAGEGKNKGKTIITVTGKKRDNPQKIQIVIDPPDEIYDYVLLFTQSESKTLLYLGIVCLIGIIVFLGMKFFRKKI